MASAAALAGTQAVPEIVDHDEDIAFNHNTWVTTITERAIFSLKSLPNPGVRVKSAFNAASPENWANADGLAEDERFFVESTPFSFDQGAIVTNEGLIDPFQNGVTHLRERTQWEWNFGEEGRAGALIDLTISSYVRTDVFFTFNYGLFRCLNYDVGPMSFRDVLDVDDGSFEGCYDDGTKLLTVKATKSIHFTPPQPGDEDEVAMLNLLAPATTAMLLRELVLDGTMRALSRAP